MRETYEFRVKEEFAPMLFAENEGERLSGTIRKVTIHPDDPRFERIGILQNELHSTGRSFFSGWDLRFGYTRAELSAAQCFRLKITSAFEPTGQECGTNYDDSEACDHVFARAGQLQIPGYTIPTPAYTCGVGSKQLSDLFLKWRRIPKSKDISRTIAGEVVVSKRLVDLCNNERITGVAFRPIKQFPASSAESKDWFQLIVQSAEAEVAPPTRTGVKPFDFDPTGRFRCPKGHVIGLNLLSEVSIKSPTRRDADVVCSRQFIGARTGLLRPERLILISPRVWRLLETHEVKGSAIEVAYLV
jgi:hypothetical protein